VRSLRFSCTLFICLLVVFSVSVQSQLRPGAPPVRTDPAAPAPEADETQTRMAHDMAKKANLAREAALKSDTEKLLKMSQELKEYVDKSNENVLSLEVLKKAEAIEKLAHSVKEKMRGAN